MEENAAPKVAVTEVVSLDNARVSLPKQIMITVNLGGKNASNGLSRAELLHKLFQRRPGDTDVRLRLMKSDDFLISYDLSDRVQADRTLCKQIEEICGSGSVEVIPG